MHALQISGPEVGALLREVIQRPHEGARYACGRVDMRAVACCPVEGTLVQNKTLITVTAIVALVAIGVAVLTLFIF